MWILYAILNPFADAARNVFSKKASNKVDSLLVSWFNNSVPLILFTPVLFFVELKFNSQFFIAITISGVINIAASILYHRAISKGDISVVVPMLSFTPLFLLIVSPIVVGEFPDAAGLTGILCIVFGSYILNVSIAEKGFFEPLKSLVRNKGTRYMLIVSFIWSISSNFDKVGITASSPMQYIFFINLFVAAGLTIFVSSKGKLKLEPLKLEWKNLLMVGIFTSAGFFFHMNALSLTLVAYVIALKRTAGMISVGLGYFFLGEENIKERLLGSAIMFIGILLIVLF